MEVPFGLFSFISGIAMHTSFPTRTCALEYLF